MMTSINDIKRHMQRTLDDIKEKHDLKLKGTKMIWKESDYLCPIDEYLEDRIESITTMANYLRKNLIGEK